MCTYGTDYLCKWYGLLVHVRYGLVKVCMQRNTYYEQKQVRDTKVAAALGFFLSPFALAATAAGDALEFADFVFATGAGTSRIWTSSSCALSTGTTIDALGDATMALAASAFLLSAFFG